jgi:hypothetical protein
LSDGTKRPGTSRDISELKARLGLKKGGPAAPAAGQAQAKNGGGNAVVPPPGVSLPAAPPQPAGPAVPSAADDPFGAMNAMAHIGTMQRAPEIVIVNDGKPVEQVGSKGALIKYAIIAIVPLVLGVVVGQISKEANIYNAGIDDAAQLLNNKTDGVTATKRKIVELQTALEEAANANFAPSKELTAKLEAILPKLDVKQEIVYRTKQNTLNADLSGQILGFYSGVAEVRSMLTEHVKSAKADDAALEKAKAAAEKAKPQGYLQGFGNYRYGILISGQSEGDNGPFGGRLVELGQPYCADGNQSRDFTCPDNNYGQGVTYRGEPGGQWTKAEPQTGGSSADVKKVIPLLGNGIADVAVKGEPGISELVYVRRLAALKDRVDLLITTANSVETKLRPKATEGKKFTFFL